MSELAGKKLFGRLVSLEYSLDVYPNSVNSFEGQFLLGPDIDGLFVQVQHFQVVLDVARAAEFEDLLGIHIKRFFGAEN